MYYYLHDYSIYGYEDTEEQEDFLKEEPKQRKRPAKRGQEAAAFRGDLSTEKMFYLRKKNYSYWQIAHELGCSPSTVRNRLNNEELLKSEWLI